MEVLPETEIIEEFQTSPVPSLRLQELSIYEDVRSEKNKKPPNIRRSTDPTPQSPRSPVSSSSPIVPYRTRNTSPLSRGHLRSKTTSTLAPPMSRAQSMPGISTSGHLLTSHYQRPSSPAGSPSRQRIPKKPFDEIFPILPARGLNDISEGGDISPSEYTPPVTERSSSPTLSLPSNGAFARHRRPASPLRYHAQPNPSVISTAPSTPTSVTSSPAFTAPRFNDAFLGTNANPYPATLNYSYPNSYASSSVPSTPTSARSRSPSISSLETIPDSPDAEEAALEAERIAQLKAAADAADAGEDGASKNALAMDAGAARGRTLNAGFGRDKRKRWSVCGAERRADLNLDTIWED